MNFSKKKSNTICVVIVMISLIILSCIGIIGVSSITNAFTLTEGEISDTQAKNLGNLLLDGYEDNVADNGKVFNGEVFWELVQQVSGIQNPNKNTLNNWVGGTRTSQDFRTTAGADVIVTIGGKKWTATYLSTNKNGEPILTFWLATSENNEVASSVWHTQNIGNAGNYNNSKYGTSWMRASVLNNGGDYAPAFNATSLTNVAQRSGSEWAIYTMDDAEGSLTSYIEAPDNMSWQLVQSAITTLEATYNNPNDAINSGMGGYYDGSTNGDGSPGYANWRNDRLWLPSIVEVGYRNDESGDGMWMTSVNQRANKVDTWLRSSSPVSTRACYKVFADGYKSDNVLDGIDVVSSSNAIRPAFHLNLKKAAEATANALSLPQGFNKTYTGNTIDAESESWHTSLLKNAIKNGDVLEIYYKGDEKLDSAPTGAGTYKIEYIIDNTTDFVWKDLTASKKEITFTINKVLLDYPSFFNGKDKLPYNGGNDVTFTLGSYNTSAIEIYFNGTLLIGNRVSAKEVDTYQLDVRLKDPDNYGWK
ncbi:MAG: hypothetical protein K2O35_01140, partial [Clostridia bacterium]|nr:hypothetical protein [Clostridia bacterium]